MDSAIYDVGMHILITMHDACRARAHLQSGGSRILMWQQSSASLSKTNLVIPMGLRDSGQSQNTMMPCMPLGMGTRLMAALQL